MILIDVLRALGQLGDPAFRRVLGLGVGLTLGVLIALTALVGALVAWLVPAGVTLPWIGTVGFLDDLAVGGAVLVLLVASVFLMAPVASVFTSLFLESVAEAVERRHYPDAAPVPRISAAQSVREGAAYLALLIAANLAAIVVYFAVPPLAPFVFVAVNGLLLGREYFQVTALRRMPAAEATRLRRRNTPQIWALGALMALPLAIPVVNLAVPVIGAAAFTHLYHRAARRRRSG